jgi:hypothetical protein
MTLNNNNKNEYNLKMGNNSDYLDTAKMEEMIRNNQVVDFSLIKSINIYHLESISQGCSFEITTKEELTISDRTFNLEFQNTKTHKNKTTKCSLYKNNNIIKCNLDEISNSNYTLNDYLDFNNNELISIISDNQNSFPMSCLIRYNNNNRKGQGLSRGVIALIIIIVIIVILISAVLAYFVYKRYNKNIKINSDPSYNCSSSARLEE